MKSSEEKKLYGLIGYPVKHSFSPFMHNAAFAHYKMEADYQLFEVAPEALGDFFEKTVAQKKLGGFNVTVPHKEGAIAYLTGKISESVKMNRAVNTVCVERDGSLSGDNTDGEGFSRDLKERGVTAALKNVSLIGAGGGAKAVATALAGQKPKRLYLFDIDQKKVASLVAIVREFFPNVAVQGVGQIEDLKIKESDILVNATPIGMKEADPLLVPKEGLHQGLFVYDLIYNPAETKLLKAAKESGCQCANGLGMLLYQGCLAFEKWTNKKAPVDVMRKALMERMRA
jgi:shikimate dehydrogenase